MSALALQALKTEKIKVLTVNPAQTSTPMTWSRPDAEYLPDKMIQPDEIAEAILMTFKMNPNVFIEVRLLLCIIVLTSSLTEIEFWIHYSEVTCRNTPQICCLASSPWGLLPCHTPFASPSPSSPPLSLPFPAAGADFGDSREAQTGEVREDARAEGTIRCAEASRTVVYMPPQLCMPMQ